MYIDIITTASGQADAYKYLLTLHVLVLSMKKHLAIIVEKSTLRKYISCYFFFVVVVVLIYKPHGVHNWPVVAK